MKRLFLALTLNLIIFGLFTSVAMADFSDLYDSHPNKVAINTLVDKTVLQGYEDGTFKPEQNVTRAEAVKIVLLGLGVSVNENSTGAEAFSDVNGDEWFYRIVGTAVDLGIISGYEDGTFKPSQTVNRAEILKMILLAGGVSTPGNVESSPFPDVAKDAWFAPYADYAKKWNIETVQLDGLWHPAGEISRANISEMVYREQLVLSGKVAFVESTNWPRRDFNTVLLSMKVPFGWYFKSDGVGAVWLMDNANGQFSLLSPYENGGTLLMTKYGNPNGDSSGVLFDKLKEKIDGNVSETKIGAFSTLVVDGSDGSPFYKEWYVMIPNNNMVHLTAMKGDGAYSPYIATYIEKIVSSMQYFSEPRNTVDVPQALESIRSAIQVDGVGESMMKLLDDFALIETDAIGVGTGPVDYFYSPSGNITIKYERSFDVILNVQNGETSSF